MRLKLRILFWLRNYFQKRCWKAQEKVWDYNEAIEADLEKHGELWPKEGEA